MRCLIKGCKNTHRTNKISFFSIPSDKNRKDAWISAIQADITDVKKAKVCSIHFDDSSFKPLSTQYVSGMPKSKRLLKETAVPTMFLAPTIEEVTAVNENDITDATQLNIQQQSLADNDPGNSDEGFIGSSAQPLTDRSNTDNYDHLMQSYTSVKKNIKEVRKANAAHVLYQKKYESAQSNLDKQQNAIEVYKKKYEEAKKANATYTRYQQKYELELLNRDKQIEKKDEQINNNTQNYNQATLLLEQSEREKKEYSKQLQILQKDNELMKKKLYDATQLLEVKDRKIEKLEKSKDDMMEMLNRIFTPGQVKLILDPKKKKTRWCAIDIAGAISLRAVSPKAYRYMRNNMHIPLPSFSTLRNWAQKLVLDEGVMDNVMDIMEVKGKKMSYHDKLCVLSADEFYLSNEMAIDRKDEEIIGPHKTCQFIMARGLFSKWKQPVYFKFDQPLTKEIIMKVIEELHKRQYRVVALTSDFGSTNQGLLKEMGVGFTACVDAAVPPCTSTMIRTVGVIRKYIPVVKNNRR